MISLRLDTDILLNDGYNEFEIDASRNVQLTFRASGQSDVFIRVKNARKLKIRTFTEANAKVSYLFWNEMNETLDVEETHEVLRDGNLTVAYGECNDAVTNRDTYVALRQSGATALLSSASLANCAKNYNMQVVNFAPHTYGNIENYAVVLEHGKLMIDAIGKIVKGAYASESHQTSRALSFAQGQTSTILPELLIDENDVQASHAMSMGRVDDEQLYYLMSRGLSMRQCTALLSTGYLLPITHVISNETIQEKLKEELEGKIASLC